MRVTGLTLRNFRNYERASLSLESGVTVVHGPVAAGKTNLLEALYLGCVGRSCRTSAEREIVRFGADAAHVVVRATNGSAEHTYEVGVEPGRPKAFRIDGARSDGPANPDRRPLVAIFLPDRLELVKGAAVSRRAHLDSFVSALWPARKPVRIAYAKALSQRNALLSRARGSSSPPPALSSWDAELARQAVALMRNRAQASDAIAARFSVSAASLGLPVPAQMSYRPRSQADDPEAFGAELRSFAERDLQRGFTTHGPHRDDFRLEAAGLDLRRFGSQGQQRLALLALLLAEREVLAEQRAAPPVMLLDDVLSELDIERRRLLLDALRAGGQALMTTADPEAAWAAGGELASVHVSEGEIE